MKTEDFDYKLPEGLIAQAPIEPRDHSRMLVYHRESRSVEHLRFFDLPRYLRPADILVLNETKVLPARLLGIKEETGVPVELLLLRQRERDVWEVLARPGRRLKPGAVCVFGDGRLRAEILSVTESGNRVVRFDYQGLFETLLDNLGHMPLPPYIRHQLSDNTRYQTVYSRQDGSAAAPTAGLHFTPELLERIRAMGVSIAPVLLHVGLGTFRPVQAEDVRNHLMHAEYYEVTQAAADTINRGRIDGGRCVCVGTTSVRVLETVAQPDGTINPGSGDTSLFLTPGKAFRATDALITNFHLPQSTLLMLVSAFMGREEALRVYEEAIREQYRFFSFGDCMLIL